VVGNLVEIGRFRVASAEGFPTIFIVSKSLSYTAPYFAQIHSGYILISGERAMSGIGALLRTFDQMLDRAVTGLRQAFGGRRSKFRPIPIPVEASPRRR